MVNILELISVTKEFGGLKAVNQVSFSAGEGEIVGLIGPNGSGKTTLINLISGTYPLSGGDIKYNGISIKSLPTFERARSGISRTFQIVKPLKNMTVRDNVMVAAIFGKAEVSRLKEISQSLSSRLVKSAYSNTDSILELVGLNDKSDRYADNLTLPDRKRLELARALAMTPKLLLLDEVMAGLNNYEVTEIMELIKKISKKGVTVIVIEHIMKAIMGVADRVIVLHHGQLIAQGKPAEIVKNPDVINAYLGKKYKVNGDQDKAQ